MRFLNKNKVDKMQRYSNSVQPSLQSFLILFFKILTLLSLIEFAKSLDYKPNHWIHRNVSEYFGFLKNVHLYKHNKYYIGMLKSSQLIIFHKSNLTLKNVYKMNPDESAGDSTLFKNNESFRDFDFVWDQHVVAITSKQRFFVVDLLTEQYQVDLNNTAWTLCSIQITKSTVYLLRKYSPFGRYKRGSLYNSQSENIDDLIKFNDIDIPDECMKMQVSEYIPPTAFQKPYVHRLAQQKTDIQYVMFYKVQGTSIYSCSKLNFQGITDCTFIRSEISKESGVNVQKASFSADCTKVILEFDDKSPLLVIDLAGNRTLTSIEQDSDVLISEFYNYQATVVMVWSSEMYITLYEVSTGIELASYDQKKDHNIMFVSVDLQQEMLIMVTDQFIYQFSFDCNNPIFYYYTVGMCTFCSERCSQEQYCDNQTAKCITNTQNLVDIVESQQGEQMGSVDPNPIKQYQETLYKQTKATVETFSQGIQIVGDLSSYVIWTFTAIPVASFFLGFINFWTICSFYVLLDIKMPQFLRTSLTNLFIALNSSMLNSVGFGFSPKLFLSEDFKNQKIRNDFAADFQLSLDFLLTNSENLLTCIFSILLYFIIFRCFFKNKSKKIQNKNCDNKIKNINETESKSILNSIFMGFGQVISICPLFFLGLMFMKGESGYLKISQKLNLIFFDISIGLLLCVSPFVITFIKLDKKYIKPVQKKVQTLQQKKSTKIIVKIKQNQEALVFYERLKWIQTLQCNITMPFFVMIGYVQACLSVNYLIFGLGIFICYKEPNVPLLRRINNVAMALEILIVNIAMSLIVVIDYLEQQNQHYLIHIVGIFCLGTILLGALHQIMNLIIIDIIIDFIVKKCQQIVCKKKIVSTKTTTVLIESKNVHIINNKQKQQQQQIQKQNLNQNNNNNHPFHHHHSQQNTIYNNEEKNIKRNIMNISKMIRNRQFFKASKNVRITQKSTQQTRKFQIIMPIKKLKFFKSRSQCSNNVNVLKIIHPQPIKQVIEEQVFQQNNKFKENYSDQNSGSKPEFSKQNIFFKDQQQKR